MLSTTILLIILVFMFGAVLKGWSGFGTNLVVPPILFYMFEQGLLDIAENQVMVYVVSVNLFLNITMIVINKKFDLKYLSNILPLVIAGIIANFIGAYMFKEIGSSAFKVMFGIMIILVTLNRIYKLKFEIKNPKRYYIPVGIISGLLNGMFGLGGVPVLIFLSSTKMDKDDFKTTLVSYFFVMNIIFIISHAVIGRLYDVVVITYIGYVLVFAVAACVLGVWMSNRVSDKLFQRVMNFVLIFFGINLIYSGFTGEAILNLFF